MTEITENNVSHLNIIQGVIIRMGSNAFALKAMAVTIAAAVIALAGSRPTGMELYPISGLLPSMLFWWMDARYLHIEKCYRMLYDSIRQGNKVAVFSMDYQPFEKDVDSTLKIFFTNWSITPFFLSVCLSLIITYIFLTC